MDARSGRMVNNLQVVQAGCSALPLAQWLERRSYEPAAAGSSPAWEKVLPDGFRAPPPVLRAPCASRARDARLCAVWECSKAGPGPSSYSKPAAERRRRDVCLALKIR